MTPAVFEHDREFYEGLGGFNLEELERVLDEVSDLLDSSIKLQLLDYINEQHQRFYPQIAAYVEEITQRSSYSTYRTNQLFKEMNYLLKIFDDFPRSFTSPYINSPEQILRIFQDLVLIRMLGLNSLEELRSLMEFFDTFLSESTGKYAAEDYFKALYGSIESKAAPKFFEHHMDVTQDEAQSIIRTTYDKYQEALNSGPPFDYNELHSDLQIKFPADLVSFERFFKHIKLGEKLDNSIKKTVIMYGKVDDPIITRIITRTFTEQGYSNFFTDRKRSGFLDVSPEDLVYEMFVTRADGRLRSYSINVVDKNSNPPRVIVNFPICTFDYNGKMVPSEPAFLEDPWPDAIVESFFHLHRIYMQTYN